MRSLCLTLILLATAAVPATAQVPTIIRPIQQAREAVAKSDARTEAAQAVVHEPVVGRKADSTRVNAAATKTPPPKPAGTTQPATKAATPATTTKSPATPPADTKAPVTASAAANGASAPAAKPAAAAPGATTTAAASAEKGGTPGTPPQAVPGKGTPAGTKAPVTSAPAAPAPGTPAPKAAAATTARDSAAATVSVGSLVNTRPELRIDREVFTYDAGGRRDPFVSLFSTSDLRPLFTDLLLVVINYDPQRRNSVAIMRDATTKEQYRVRQGQLIGRMRVSAIEQKRVLFTIDEFGFSRQESLVIGDTTKVRKQ